MILLGIMKACLNGIKTGSARVQHFVEPMLGEFERAFVIPSKTKIPSNTKSVFNQILIGLNFHSLAIQHFLSCRKC